MRLVQVTSSLLTRLAIALALLVQAKDPNPT